MFKYDPAFDPPAPIVAVAVSDPDTGKMTPCSALIDTGASISVVPASLARDLDLRPHSRVKARAVGNQVIDLSTYLVRLIVAGQVIADLEVAAYDRQTMLLGRDILQLFILTLDGKAGVFTLVDP